MRTPPSRHNHLPKPIPSLPHTGQIPSTLVNLHLMHQFRWGGGGEFSSVTQSCPTLCEPMDCSTPGLPIHHPILELTQTHVHWVSDAFQPSHPLLSHPLILSPSIFPSIRIFSNESALHIRWPTYWSFSFNISPSNEHSGLTSFRMAYVYIATIISFIAHTFNSWNSLVCLFSVYRTFFEHLR